MPTAPTALETTLRRAIEVHQAGRWTEAEGLYRQILETEPKHADALHLLGVVCNQQGRPEVASGMIREAIALRPDRAEFHNSLGNALRALGDRTGAAAAFEHALTLKPESVEVWTNLGALLEEAGNFEDATLCYLRALEFDPGYGDAHFTLGNLLKRVGNVDQAALHYEQAIACQCEYAAEAHNNLGNLLRSRGSVEEAVEHFRRAIHLRGPYFEAHMNLGDALEQLGSLEEAARIYQEALVLRPESAMAYSGAAGVLQDQGRSDRASAAYRKALQLAPENAALHSNYLLNLHYDPAPSRADLLEAHQVWGARHARPLTEAAAKHTNRADPDRALRVGFVSADLRRHPVGFFLQPLLSRSPGDIEAFCYSDVTCGDDLTEKLRSAAGRWRPTAGYADEELAEVIRADEVDILIDLAGHTRGNRLLAFARRPAPVQVTWAGYVNTTGMQAMDYLISDARQTPPGAERWFVETVISLPDGYVCYAPPEDARSQGPCRRKRAVTSPSAASTSWPR
jgi:protein O-GlcNAc transferase